MRDGGQRCYLMCARRGPRDQPVNAEPRPGQQRTPETIAGRGGFAFLGSCCGSYGCPKLIQ